MTTLLDQVQARLATVDALKSVSGAAAFARLTDTRTVPPRHLQPAAWVTPLADRAAESNRATYGVRQTVTARFGVVIATSDASDARGDAASQDIDAVQRAVRDGLVGWLPTGFARETHYAGGQSMGFSRGVVWWLSEFTVQEIIGS